MAAYVPPGWPAGVHPPGSDEFEQTAVAWLLDVVPPDYRLHGVLRRHPVALAVLARHHLAACIVGARDGYRTARAELGEHLPPGGVEAVLEAYRTEGSRLVETARAVDLVGRALLGEVFTPQLAGTQDEGRSTARGSTDRGSTDRGSSAGQRAGNGQRARGKRADTKQRAETRQRAETGKQRAGARQRAAGPDGAAATGSDGTAAVGPDDARPAKQR